MATVDISCAADARYLRHAAAMLHSAAEMHGADLRVHFLHGPDLADGDKRRLEGMLSARGAEIAFLAIDPDRVRGLPSMDYISVTMWYRIFLPELLPSTTRVLYLDVDTIVQDSLDPLWDIDLEGVLVAAVTNVFQRVDPAHPEPFELARSKRPYFNSGVLLMNLDLMREEDATARLLAYVRANLDDLGWPDQDALNHILGSKALALHPRWNAMNSFYVYPWSEETFGRTELEQAKSDPAIRHFEGPSVNKPWHLLCEREMKDLYSRHRRGTPWPRYVPDGITPANVWRLATRRARVEAA